MRIQFTKERAVAAGSNVPIQSNSCRANRHAYGFTLAEVVISIAVTGLAFAGILTGYVQSARQAEWSGYSLAAQAFAVKQIEQARSAIWDNSSGTGRNELTNLNLTGWTWTYSAGVGQGTGSSAAILDLPYSGTNTTWATNYVTLRMFYFNNVANPPVQLQMLQVDTVWPFAKGKALKYFTNSVATYYAPDNRDPNTL